MKVRYVRFPTFKEFLCCFVQQGSDIDLVLNITCCVWETLRISRYINLSCLKLWFFTFDPLPDLIIVLWRTNFKSIPFEKEQGLQQCYCYPCLDVETKLQSSWLYTSYIVLCQLWWSSFWRDASDDHCFWWPCFWWRVFRSSSSDSFLQTHFFRRISSDAFFQTLYASNKIPLLFDLFNQNLYE